MVSALGFVDLNDVCVKANGLALQIRLLAKEDMPISLYSTGGVPAFDSVKEPVQSLATKAPGSGLAAL